MIFFDIDDTLVNSVGAHKLAIRQVAVAHRLEVGDWTQAENLWISTSNRFLNQYFEGKISLGDQRTSRLISFWNEFGQNLHKTQANSIYADYHHLFLESCQLFDDVLPSLGEAASFSFGIISNGVLNDQLFKLEKNGILNQFQQVIVSEQSGCSKPDRQIFDMAAQRSEKHISECYYIGDNYHLDYLGAKNAGMKSFWLNRSSIPEDPLYDGFQSLKDIISQINFHSKTTD